MKLINFFIFLLIIKISSTGFYEKVRPYVFETVNVPIISGYSDKTFNSKNEFLNCSHNINNIDKDLFKIYQDHCLNSLNSLNDAFSQFCLFTKSKEHTRIERTRRYGSLHLLRGYSSNERLRQEIDSKINIASRNQTIFTIMMVDKLLNQIQETKYKIFELRSAFKSDFFVQQLISNFNFSSLNNITDFAKFYKFKDCKFNRSDSTLKINLIAPQIVQDKKIIKFDAFTSLDSKNCLLEYTGPELFVFDILNNRYYPLKQNLFQLINDNQPLIDDFNENYQQTDFYFSKNCSKNYATKELNQIKIYDKFYYIYCFPSQVKFNQNRTIDCPNSVFRTSITNNITVDGQMLTFIQEEFNSTTKFDNEINKKLLEDIQHTVLQLPVDKNSTSNNSESTIGKVFSSIGNSFTSVWDVMKNGFNNVMNFLVSIQDILCHFVVALACIVAVIVIMCLLNCLCQLFSFGQCVFNVFSKCNLIGKIICKKNASVQEKGLNSEKTVNVIINANQETKTETKPQNDSIVMQEKCLSDGLNEKELDIQSVRSDSKKSEKNKSKPRNSFIFKKRHLPSCPNLSEIENDSTRLDSDASSIGQDRESVTSECVSESNLSFKSIEYVFTKQGKSDCKFW